MCCLDTISVVVPCYNEEAAVSLFFAEMQKVAPLLKDAQLEYVFVDDGSTDGTLRVMRELAGREKNVHYLSFSRNFGKEAGMLAGLRRASGDYVAVMDADLQDPPSLLPQMLDALRTGECDCAAARRTTRRGEPPVRSAFAKLFYRIINRISQTEIVDGARDFRLMTRAVTDAILQIGEYNRFSKGIFSWVGFRTTWFAYENIDRAAGRTKWSFWKLLVYSIDGITAFSTVPLSVAAVVGLAFCALAFLMTVFVFVRALIWGDPVGGWPSLACIILFVGGVQLFCTGIIGQYLAKAYLEVKRRPQYIIREEK